jgi:uncharacterized protein YdhG (YjbR/CyaY superfamily)
LDEHFKNKLSMDIELKSIDEYINSFPSHIKLILNEVRNTIRETAPNAVESITYKMPTFKINGKPLVYFAAFRNHIGLYATPTAHNQFSVELTNYKHGKGSIQFPLNKPIPFDLIRRIVEFKLNENKSNK